jgi:F-type H+-transporting ATPase subunit b
VNLPHLDYTTYSSQIFWLLLSFALLYFAVSRVILPKIQDTLQNRDRKIKSDLDRTDSLSKMSQELEVEYDHEIQNTQKIVLASVGYIEKKTAEEHEIFKAKLKQDMQLQLENTEKELEVLRKNLYKDSTESILDFAKLYYELVFGQACKEELRGYVDRLLKKHAD